MRADQADRLISGFSEWARREPSCRALGLIGSWARGEARPDSDLDLIVLAEDLDRWVGSHAWLQRLTAALDFSPGEPRMERYGAARSWRVMLGASVELELTFVDPSWAALDPIDEGTRLVVLGGLQALVDKDDRLATLQAAIAP